MDGFTPETIIDQPIPLLGGGFTPVAGSVSNANDSIAETPIQQVDRKFPQAQIAQQTISESLNTETKRITGEYTFEQLGAILVGLFKQGISGEIKISPDGIVAKNVNGEITFALDGATGDATFKGTIEAAGFTIADETGLHSLNNFITGATTPSGAQNTTSSSYTDITSQTLSFTLARQSRVLIMYSTNMLNTSAGADGTGSNVCLTLDGTDETGSVLVGTGTPTAFGVVFVSASASTIQTLAAGAHTIKLRMRSVQPAGTTQTNISAASLIYIIFGS